MPFLRPGTVLCSYFLLRARALKWPRPQVWVFGQGNKAGEHCGKCVPLCPRFLALEDTHNLCVMCLGQELALSVLKSSVCGDMISTVKPYWPIRSLKKFPVGGENSTCSDITNQNLWCRGLHDNTETGVFENLHPGRSFQKCLVSVTWCCVCVWTNGQTA